MKSKTSKKMKWATGLMMINVLFMIPSLLGFFIPDLYPGIYLQKDAGMTLEMVRNYNEGVYKVILLGFQGIGFGVLCMHIMYSPIILFPYRKGEKWAWFTLLAEATACWVINMILEAQHETYSMVFYSIIPLTATAISLFLSYQETFSSKSKS